MEISELVEAEGLVGALRFAREVVHAAAQQCPMWALPEGQVGEVFGLARQVQAAAEAVGALAAREAHGRGLAGCDGLSAVDWLRVQAPGLDPREAPGDRAGRSGADAAAVGGPGRQGRRGGDAGRAGGRDRAVPRRPGPGRGPGAPRGGRGCDGRGQ